MQFLNTILFASILAAVANANIQFTNTDLANLSGGQSITLTWTGASSTEVRLLNTDWNWTKC